MIRAERLAPSFHPKVWGSPNLAPWFSDADQKIGEVWFTSDPPPPLLLKFLFTTEKLSVQVHPRGENGKTEMWHVLRAEAGAAVAVGFREQISPARLRESAESGEIEQLLHWIEVRPGDTIFVPAGTVHAIGAGLAICEIQQYSDVTYRLFDYGRPRELHLDSAVAVADMGRHPGVTLSEGEHLVRCEYFDTSRISVDGTRAVSGDLLAVVEGEGAIDGRPCKLGEVWRLFDTVKLEGRIEALITRVP